MQFTFDSRSAKKLARSLESYLATQDIKLPHGKALDALAIMQGHSSWNALAANLRPEAIDEQLAEIERTHMQQNLEADYGEECEMRAHTGFALRYDALSEQCEYVRVVDPLGREIAYWSSDEWAEDPALVMGAILGALVRGSPLEVALTKKAGSSSVVKLDTPLALYVAPFALDGEAESPRWARILIDQSLLTRLLRLRDQVKRERFGRLSVPEAPDRWSTEVDDGFAELSLRGEQLELTAERFWYSAYEKHAEYGIETPAVNFDALLAIIAGAEQAENGQYRRFGNVAIYCPNPAMLNEFIDTLIDEGIEIPGAIPKT